MIRSQGVPIRLPRSAGIARLTTADHPDGHPAGLQMTRAHGGLGRRYRDPRFDTLAECTQCRGAGFRADVRCLPCLGTGRVTIRGVS
jgi:hypothetical protein